MSTVKMYSIKMYSADEYKQTLKYWQDEDTPVAGVGYQVQGKDYHWVTFWGPDAYDRAKEYRDFLQGLPPTPICNDVSAVDHVTGSAVDNATEAVLARLNILELTVSQALTQQKYPNEISGFVEAPTITANCQLCGSEEQIGQLEGGAFVGRACLGSIRMNAAMAGMIKRYAKVIEGGPLSRNAEI